MNRRIETALRSKYNFRKRCSAKETNELCAQGYNNFYIVKCWASQLDVQHIWYTQRVCVCVMRKNVGASRRKRQQWIRFMHGVKKFMRVSVVSKLSASKVIRDTVKAYSGRKMMRRNVRAYSVCVCDTNYAHNTYVCDTCVESKILCHKNLCCKTQFMCGVARRPKLHAVWIIACCR